MTRWVRHHVHMETAVVGAPRSRGHGGEDWDLDHVEVAAVEKFKEDGWLVDVSRPIDIWHDGLRYLVEAWVR